jgi:hypothetical protein
MTKEQMINEITNMTYGTVGSIIETEVVLFLKTLSNDTLDTILNEVRFNFEKRLKKMKSK